MRAHLTCCLKWAVEWQEGIDKGSLEKLAEGGNGAVYKAAYFDGPVAIQVAIKSVRPALMVIP